MKAENEEPKMFDEKNRFTFFLLTHEIYVDFFGRQSPKTFFTLRIQLFQFRSLLIFKNPFPDSKNALKFYFQLFTAAPSLNLTIFFSLLQEILFLELYHFKLGQEFYNVLVSVILSLHIARIAIFILAPLRGNSSSFLKLQNLNLK